MKIHLGDCRESMRRMIAEGVRVQMCVTSPPYWGLRDYGHPGQLGLEPTPAEYVANMVEVFRLVRELLADDGTCWINLGDSYAADRGGHCMPAETLAGGVNGKSDYDDPLRGRVRHKQAMGSRNAPSIGLKHKDLCGIPWRVAFALQADGWYLRQDIIWAKPNPMPESVTDRCTKSHEYLFLLSKRERYYYDAAAIAEPAISAGESRGGGTKVSGNGYAGGALPPQHLAVYGETPPNRNKRSVWTVATQPYSEAHFATFPPALIEPCILAGSRPGDVVLDPFFGSGTTGQVCERLGRKWLGCELSPEYGKLAAKRTAQQGMMFAQEAAP